MGNYTEDTSQKSLYASIFIVGLFVSGLLVMPYLQAQNTVNRADNALAGSQEAVDSTTPPIGGSDEQVIVTASPSARPTRSPIPILTATPSAIPTVPPTLAPITAVIPTLAPTPVPTFALNLPGETDQINATPVPAVAASTANNMPIIIGVIVGILLIAGGIILVLVKRQNKEIETYTPTTPPAMPTQMPSNQSYPQQPYQGEQTNFNTPYDQYVNNQPKGPNQ